MDAVTTFESSFEACGAEGGVQRLDVIPAGPARRRWTTEATAIFMAGYFAIIWAINGLVRKLSISSR